MLTACGSSDSIDNKTKAKTKLQVITSIKPIQMIVLAIAGDNAQSEQLIPDFASPHNYSFKPSDIRKVKKADVVFRIDEHMETQLETIFKSLESKIKVISLAETKGLKLLESAGNHDEHESENHEKVDFHIWTSPKNALIMATSVVETLSELDPKNATDYQRNFAKFSAQLKIESDSISAKLIKYQKSPYIVFHNSWQYFSNAFGLQNPIVIDMHESVSSGVKTIRIIREKIRADKIGCVFYDTTISESRLKLLTENVNTANIDVLAKDIEMNQSAYIDWLKQLTEQVETCLSAN